MAGLAPRLPLQRDEIDGAYGLITTFFELVEQNFKMLLLTAPGERIMNPDYGVGLRNYLFENTLLEDVVQSQVKARIISQANRYMSYIDIGMISFSMIDNEPNGIYLYVEYNIIPLNVDRTFESVQKFDKIF